MRHLITTAFVVLSVVGALAAPQKDNAPPIVGTWSGPYDGDSTGTYSMTISQDASKALTGTVQVNGDGDSYTAKFKSITAQKDTATLKYDSPSGGEVQLDVIVDGQALKGTWKATEPGTATPSSTGTFTGTRK
jgi:uncharacterized protein (DUF2147 family)